MCTSGAIIFNTTVGTETALFVNLDFELVILRLYSMPRS
jgi:hypothetical protein